MYKKGQFFEEKRNINIENIIKFADVSGDYNPIHLDEKVARDGPFGRIIAHGMLGGALISATIGTHFPGNGTIYMEQNLKFNKPVYLGDELLIHIEISDLLDRNRAILITDIFNQKGERVISGEAKVILPKEE